MKTNRRILVIIMLVVCCFNMEAYNRGNRLVSSDMSIQGDIRKQRNGNGISVSMSGADASITRSGGMSAASRLRSDQSGYGSAFGSSPMSLAKTTMMNADGETGPGETNPNHEFGECPNYDATPVGDAIVPMLLLLGLYVAVKRFRRVP